MRIHRIAHRALLCLLTTTCILAQAQTASNQGAVPQVSTPGQFAVSPSGAATYRIPIQVPPGVAGMQPKLEVVYSSQSGNGFLGLGWGLSGLSTVTRCPRTQAQDGARGGVNFDANDRFCMDGQRLILVSGTYGVGADGILTVRADPILIGGLQPAFEVLTVDNYSPLRTGHLLTGNGFPIHLS